MNHEEWSPTEKEGTWRQRELNETTLILEDVIQNVNRLVKLSILVIFQLTEHRAFNLLLFRAHMV